MKYIFISFLIFSTFSLTLILKAEEKPETWGVGFQPIIGYDDDTNWVFGAASVFYFNPNPMDKNQELDELDLTTTYNLRGGYEINTNIIKNSKGNHSILEVSSGYQKIVSDDYGTGSESDESNKITYTSIDFPFGISYLFKVYDHLYIGPVYDSLYHRVSNIENESALSSGERSGSDTFSSGIGISMTYKTTNPGLYKRRGFHISLSSIYYSPSVFSDTSFESYGIGYRHYFTIFEKCVFGLHLDYEGVHGDVPLNYLPELGGSKILRGFSSTRYIAENRLAGQAEFRFPVWWRFGGTVFVGAGEAEDSFGNFGSNIKMAGGLGFRVAVKRKQNLNIRFDISYNSDGDIKPYIRIKEAF